MRKTSCVIALATVCIIPVLVGAEIYEPLTTLPGFAEASVAASQGDFANMINTIYRMSIGIAGALAVLVIVGAGVTYSVSTVAGTKETMKERIRLSLFGLLLLVGAYMILDYINPNLTNLRAVDKNTLDLSQAKGVKLVDAYFSENTSFLSGQSTEDLRESVENPTIEEYQELFNRTPDPRRANNGRITLNNQEYQELLNNTTSGPTMSLGKTINFGTRRCDKNDKDAPFTVSKEGQIAIIAATNICPGIPHSWANQTSLYKTIACESSGKIGIYNQQYLQPYMKSRGISNTQMAGHIRSDTFYQRHCCRLKFSERYKNNVLSEPGGASCNPDLQSGLMDMQGACYSAAGFGQLLIVNQKDYQPSGVAGFGNASEEICGMLSYIKSRYGSPENAWNGYNTDKDGNGKVDWDEEGY